jgi:hypothetical protein
MLQANPARGRRASARARRRLRPPASSVRSRRPALGRRISTSATGGLSWDLGFRHQGRCPCERLSSGGRPLAVRLSAPWRPGGWELFAPCGHSTRRAITLRRRIEDASCWRATPPYADLFFNVACCESLAGQKDEAIAHLRRAIELSEQTRPFLEGDSDLDPIREDPAFKELLAG